MNTPSQPPESSAVTGRRELLLASFACLPLMGCQSAAPPRPSQALKAGAQTLPVGTHVLTLPLPALGANSQPMRVHAHRPASWQADGPVAVVLHGLNRDAERYLANWVPLAEAAGVLVAVPEFASDKFPGRSYYNFGNVVDEQMQLRPREQWVFEAIDQAFDAVAQAFGAKRQRFALYGHSAGAQFAHRYLLMAKTSRASLIITANAGSYTLPNRQEQFPWGLANTAVSADDLRRAFARPVVVLLGDADIDPQHPNLPSDPQARAQGPHRLARGQHFFATAQLQAQAQGAEFRWLLQTVPGVGHSDRGMGPAAMQLIRNGAAA